MRQNRYKAQFAGASSHHRYAELSTWMFGGVFIIGFLTFIFPPRSSTNEFYVLIGVGASLLPLFILKLFAQDYNYLGKIISILAGTCCVVMLALAFYFIGVGGGLLSMLCALYYALLCWLSFDEYEKIQYTYEDNADSSKMN